MNNFKTQRRSIRKMKSSRINDDMNYDEYLPRPKIEKRQISTVIETELRPVLSATKDFEPHCIQGCISNITNTNEESYHLPSLPKPNNAVGLASNARYNLPDNTDKCSKSNTFMAIDDFPNMDSDLKQKLKIISAKNSLSITLETTSTLKMQDKLSSNRTICPEFIDSQITCISPKNKSNSSEFLKIMNPLVSKLEEKSDIHDSNSDFNTNTSQCEIIDYGNTKKLKKNDCGFIFTISNTVILPSLFWKSTHLSKENTTAFCYQRFSENAEKKIYFFNSLVPVVQLYGKNYKFSKPILSKNQLQNLLYKIDRFEKCSGGYEFVCQKCIGYFDNGSNDTEMCTAKDLQKCKESKTIKLLKNKIAKRKSVPIKLRDKRKRI